MMRAYFRAASRESSSDLAPVTTTLPEANTSAVVLGSRIRMMTAANRYSSGARGKAQNRVQSRVLKRLEGRTRGARLTFGLYSALRACNAIVLRSSLHSRLTVATKFLQGGFAGTKCNWVSTRSAWAKSVCVCPLLAVCASPSHLCPLQPLFTKFCSLPLSLDRPRCPLSPPQRKARPARGQGKGCNSLQRRYDPIDPWDDGIRLVVRSRDPFALDIGC
jgi:hypothetical protein